MKNLISYFMMFMLFATACTAVDTGDPTHNDGENGAPSIQLGTGVEQEIILEADGGSEIIRFTSSQSWYVELPEGASWLELSPTEGEPGNGRVKVKAGANISEGIRRAEFKVCSGDLSVQFSVVQDSYEIMFDIHETEMHISASGGIIPIPINTNQDFFVVSDQDWIIPAISQARRPEYVVVAAEPNLTSEPRTSEVVVSCDVAEITVLITQDAAEGLLTQWTEKSFASRSLAMRFTADWCGYCPMMATAFDAAKQQMKDAFEIVSLHGSESAYEFNGTNQLGRRFDISGYPTGIVDSRASIPNYEPSTATTSIAVQVAQETKKSYPTVSGIAVDSHLSGTELTVFVPIYFHQPDAYRVTVLLLEDGIVGYQNGGGSRYTHNDVARTAMTSMSGESVKIESANTVWSQVYTAKVASSWNPDNLKVLVYVERPYGDQPMVREVEYASYGNYGDTYVDNCRAVKVGEMGDLELR